MSIAATVTPPADAPRLVLDPFDDDFLADPYAYHEALREAGPVFWLDRYGIYGMARHAEVSASLKDWETFCSARGVGLADFSKEEPWRPPSLLLEVDPPIHDRTRGLMNKIVALPKLKALRPKWLAAAEDLIDGLVRKGAFDGVADLAEAFPMRVFADVIGLPREGRAHLLVYARQNFNAFGPRNALLEQSMRDSVEAVAWVNESCKRKNLSEGWGLDIYRAADEGGCTQDEAERLVRSILTAGFDTTVNGIGNMTYAFAQNPAQWDKLRADPSLAKRAFEESLRWDSTVQIFFRTTTRDVQVADTLIPEGSKVVLFLAAANRDPRRWENAEAFDITRSASGHVGFGFGIHQCLGQMVARQESELVLDAMLPRVKSIRMTGQPTRRLNNTLHALGTLPLKFEPA